MALILGISKNTIVNVESDWRRKDEIDNKRVFSQTVVISIIILFSHTETISNVIGEEQVIEAITNRAFCLNSSKKSMLSKNTISGLITSVTRMSDLGATLGNISAATLLSLFNKGEKNKQIQKERIFMGFRNKSIGAAVIATTSVVISVSLISAGLIIRQSSKIKKVLKDK